MDPARDKTIAAAVLQVLVEVGYRGLTMDEVAMAAGVSKATIYRRWSSKEDLVLSFLEVASDDAILSADTGSLRGDLLLFMNSTVETLQGPIGRATRAVIGAVAEEPAVAEAYRRGLLCSWDTSFGEILARAAARGEVDPAVGTRVASYAGGATVLQLWYLRGQPLDDAAVTAIVDEVMMPLLASRTRSPEPHDPPEGSRAAADLGAALSAADQPLTIDQQLKVAEVKALLEISQELSVINRRGVDPEVDPPPSCPSDRLHGDDRDNSPEGRPQGVPRS
jgi:AcrR family transcriptional regulator